MILNDKCLSIKEPLIYGLGIRWIDIYELTTKYIHKVNKTQNNNNILYLYILWQYF